MPSVIVENENRYVVGQCESLNILKQDMIDKYSEETGIKTKYLKMVLTDTDSTFYLHIDLPHFNKLVPTNYILLQEGNVWIPFSKTNFIHKMKILLPN